MKLTTTKRQISQKLQQQQQQQQPQQQKQKQNKKQQLRPQSSSLLTSLPTEILHEILAIVLKDSLLKSIDKQRPIFALSQYRSLIMTCKFFKIIIDSAKLKLAIRCLHQPQKHGFIIKTIVRMQILPSHPRGTAHNTLHNSGSCCTVCSLETWNAVFKSFQLIAVRHISNFSTKALGRFYCNPYILLDDIPNLGPNFLQLLQPLFERFKRRPTDIERKSIFHQRGLLSHSPDEIVSVMVGRTKKIVSYSVRTWKARTVCMSSLSVSARVKEWWIIETRYYYGILNTYVVGYCGKDWIIISANDWKIHRRVEARKPTWR